MSGDERTQGFRAEINGLRAWAVALVVLFHFRIPGFSGGFIGVDVFFVISGYLMARIVHSGIRRGNFSWPSFLLSRFRRIFPAAATMCGCLLIFGWLYLSAIEYEALARQVLSSLSFTSNFQYWKESGYFDAASHDKWLLHTWSLSVEAQFYLVFPALMIGFLRLSTTHPLRTGLGLTAAISLFLGIWQTQVEPSAAFFLLPARTWELLLGALVATWTPQLALSGRQRRALHYLGLILILLAALLLDGSLAWPGAWALVPVCGTAMVLGAACGESWLTGNTVVQWLGSRSYSIYLWHWPVVVLLGFLLLDTDIVAIVFGIAATLVLAALSYRLIERPFLNRAPLLVRQGGRIGAPGAALGIVVAAAMIISRDGVSGRISAGADLAARESTNRFARPASCENPRSSPGSSCQYGGTRVGAILIGDSHAQSVASALVDASSEPEVGILAWIYPSCITIFSARMTPGVFRSGDRCPEFNDWVQRAIVDYPADVPVVLLSRTTTYILGYTERHDGIASGPGIYFSEPAAEADDAFLEEFSKELVASTCLLAKHRKVFLVRPIPEMGINVPQAMARSLALGSSRQPSLSLKAYRLRHEVVIAAQDAASRQCNAEILDPLPMLCKAGQCVSAVNDRPIYYDDDHLSEFGNKLLVPMFRAVFTQP